MQILLGTPSALNPYGLPNRLGCFAGLGDAEMMKFLGAKGTKLNRTQF
jgi:hypothetical protein